ncbi:MAG: signal recognition particle protein [Dehalococcoidia bacterium]|nr:MAG: signal recognition particle protein [Dehalococcoidia bacterium]
MFEILSDKLSKVFRLLGNKGKLTEKDIDEGLRQVRLALLEADVNFKVVKDFIGRVRERALGAEVQQSLTPGQQVVKIVKEELVVTLGKEPSRLSASGQPPFVAMLVGLQGSGKTTTAAKLALHLKHSGQRPMLVAADNRRPAAIEQLVTLGKQLDIPVYSEDTSVPSQDVCAHALAKAKSLAATWVVVDTAGRLHSDEEMMKELAEVRKTLHPAEVLLVVDAMTGQDAVRSAEDFHARVNLTGLILTKMDGDARGGAALSIRWVSGVPIKFIGVGEKVEALEPFYPDRLASRLMGMGDVLTFIEKAEAAFDESQAEELKRKVEKASFDLEDFLSQLRTVKQMGPVGQLLDMLPGVSRLAAKLPEGMEEKQLQKVEAMILSMTAGERRNPGIIGGSRRRRIARGSGVQPHDVNQLLNQFHQMQKLMKMGVKGKLPRNMMGMFRQ